MTSSVDLSEIKQENKGNEKILPILNYKNEVLKKIRNNSVTIITGPTGCGKTTKVPQFILDDAIERKEKCNILVSQPRKIAAITLAKRVSFERKVILGSSIGYQVGLDKKKETFVTKILFCTTGVILQKIIHEKGIESYTHIILDEIHERDINTDLLITIIRNNLFEGTCNAKIILMSATIDIDRFVKYFTLVLNTDEYLTIEELNARALINTTNQKKVILCNPKVIKISSEENDYTIEIKYLDDLFHLGAKLFEQKSPSISQDIMSLAAKIVICYLRESDKSVLLFLPGIFEIESAYAVLKTCTELKEKCMFCVLHSSLPASEQKEVFRPATLPKVILSTNIAESSVTIPNIGCVIDFCLMKSIVKSDSSALSSLKLEWTTKHSCTQRAGRTGRVCNGKVFRLVEKSFYDALPEGIKPEMERAPLETTILRIKQLDYETPHLFLCQVMNPPKQETIFHSILILKELGALTLLDIHQSFNPIDGDLTFLGHIMATLPVDPQIAKLIALGYMFSVLGETIIIAAGLTVKNLFKNHFDQKMQDYTQKLYWANGSSCDSISILNAYRFWQQAIERGNLRKREKEENFCDMFNFERRALHEMRQLIHEIENRLEDLMLNCPQGNVWNERETHFIIKLCIAGAFIPNYYMQRETDEHDEREVLKTLCNLDPNRTVYFRKMDRNCIGELYEDQIKEHLVKEGIADTTENIKIFFDSSKMLVMFSNSESMIDEENYCCDAREIRKNTIFPSKIPKEVFKSIFFRKIKFNQNRLSIKRFFPFQSINSTMSLKVIPSQHEEEEYAKNQGLGEVVNGIFKRRQNLISNPKKCILPSYATKSLVGIVTHIEHCNKFYFQPLDGSEIYLQELWTKFTFEKFKNIQNPQKKMLVIVFHEGIHKRAQIEDIFDHNAICFIIDYGYKIEVPFNELLTLNDEKMNYYFSLSERCLECSLTEISPNYIKCHRGKWTLKSIDVFRQMVLNQECKIDVYSVVNDKVSVTLYSNGINVNEYMIESFYAKKCKESLPSKINHNERVNVQFSGNWIAREIEFAEKINNFIKISIKSPPMNDCRKIINLEGPFSPLEFSIDGITIKRNGSVTINQHSVNHVILDDNFSDNRNKLIVATEVLTNTDENSLTLYNVTIMPSINGFPALLAMIFAPTATFYRNDIGDIVQLRFGLGAYSDDNKPILYEHDCILPVNFAVEDDIDDVNELRKHLFYLYNQTFSFKDYDNKNYKPIEIKRLVLKIFSKDRPEKFDSTANSLDDNWNSKAAFNLIYGRGYLEQIYELSKLQSE